MTPERWQQIEGLCHAAMGQSVPARATLLAGACEGDQDLRREVESLLEREGAAAEFLATPAFTVDRAGGPGAGQRSLVGRCLGPYRVESVLAAGGMGEVYRARDTKLDREVAIKTLAAHAAADPGGLARFDREAHILAGLTHPAILTVHDVGTADGIPFVVTELLDGETLRDVLIDRPPSPRQALSLTWQVADGLAAAHRQGIVHRDLKPENLFLTLDGRMKILDFGLATRTTAGLALEGPPLESTGSHGVLVGTVAYMAPEQVSGQWVDARADVFALGVVLYELLTGHHPFRRDSIAATVHAILHHEPPLPTAVNAAVPALASAVVHRCLARACPERYPDALALAQALAAVFEASAWTASQGPAGDASPPDPRARAGRDAANGGGREADAPTVTERRVW